MMCLNCTTPFPPRIYRKSIKLEISNPSASFFCNYSRFFFQVLFLISFTKAIQFPLFVKTGRSFYCCQGTQRKGKMILPINSLCNTIIREGPPFNFLHQQQIEKKKKSINIRQISERHRHLVL